MAGLPHEFPDGSEQLRFARFQNRKQDQGSKMKRSATVADQVVLKLAAPAALPYDVQRPWQIRRFSTTRVAWHRFTPGSATMADQAGLKPVGADTPFEQGLSISKNCKIYQVFLFLRPARSFFRSGSRISASVYSRPDGGMDLL